MNPENSSRKNDAARPERPQRPSRPDTPRRTVTIFLPASLGSFRAMRDPQEPREPHDPALRDDRGAQARTYRLPEGRIVRRARGPYLYDQHGDRYLDLWGADGAAFLGHRPRGYSRLAKEEIDRGLWGPFPTQWPHRLRRAVTGLVRAAMDESDPNGRMAPTDGVAAGVSVCILNGLRTGGMDDRTVSRWLPTTQLPVNPDRTLPAAKTPATPSPTSSAGGPPVGLVLPAPGVSVAGYRSVEEIPAFTLALLTRSVDMLGEYLSSEECRLRCDLAMEMAVPPGYTRHGVWFVPDDASGNGDAPGAAPAPADEWRLLQERALESRIVLPPDGATPVVIPDGIGRTDVIRWKRLCDEWPL